MGGLNEIYPILLLSMASMLLFFGIFTINWQVNWQVRSVHISSGLFSHCVEEHCVSHEEDEAVKWMEIVGLSSAVFCSICMTVHQALKRCTSRVISSFPQLVFFVSIGGAGLVFIGCAIYAIDKFGSNVYPGFSYGLTLIGGVLLIFGGAASS